MTRAYNRDCMDAMREYPDKYFELAIVDPPYGINATTMTMGTHLTRTGDGYPGESVAQRLRKGRLNLCQRTAKTGLRRRCLQGISSMCGLCGLIAAPGNR